MHVRAYVCMYVCMHVCMHVCMYDYDYDYDCKSGFRLRSLYTHSITLYTNKISCTYNNYIYIKHINYET